VIGIGVIGLSSAIELLRAGWQVVVMAKDLPPHTTSNVAAAFWNPFLAEPQSRVLPWAKTTLDAYYVQITQQVPGVSAAMLEQLYGPPVPSPNWFYLVKKFNRLTPNELPNGYREGFRSEIIKIETPLYMPWLMAQVLELGGQVQQQTVNAFEEVAGGVNCIINCSGLGARVLANDKHVYPVRGQVVRMTKPAQQRIVLVERGPHALCYIVPRSNDCIVGGTATADDYNEKPRLDVAEDILGRARQVMPALQEMEVLEHLVGLRPARHLVRLERELVPGLPPILHNYGHGGSGFTLSWGCAIEVMQMANQLV